MSGDPAQSYFSDGLSAEVRSALARNVGLQVVSQTSSNKFRDKTDDAKTIANKLNVAYLLDGNVRKSGAIVHGCPCACCADGTGPG
jgi:TolB-like protein